MRFDTHMASQTQHTKPALATPSADSAGDPSPLTSSPSRAVDHLVIAVAIAIAIAISIAITKQSSTSSC